MKNDKQLQRTIRSTVLLTGLIILGFSGSAVAAADHRDRHETNGVFEDMDADRDGTISPDEFPGSKLRFGVLDIDSNGILSVDELETGGHDPQRRHSRRGRHFKKTDLDGDGVISREEFGNEADRRFEEFDTDGDGVLGFDEIKKGHRRFGKRHFRHGPVRHLEKLDDNDDGIVSQTEFIQGTQNRFSELDADGDRNITASELRGQAAKMRQKRHGGHHLLEKADKNDDGDISADEFNAFSDQRFERLDKNGDGQISNDELKHKGRSRCTDDDE